MCVCACVSEAPAVTILFQIVQAWFFNRLLLSPTVQLQLYFTLYILVLLCPCLLLLSRETSFVLRAFFLQMVLKATMLASNDCADMEPTQESAHCLKSYSSITKYNNQNKREKTDRETIDLTVEIMTALKCG